MNLAVERKTNKSLGTFRRVGVIGATAALLLGAAGFGTGALAAARPHRAAKAPTDITVGTLYASSGSFATSSLAQYQGLEFWAKQVNRQGGVYVKAYRKKIHVKIVAYNDQSSTSTATSLYTQLITQDHVNLLVSDFGSVLTSVAIPIAKEHHMLLFDVTGTGASFFQPPTPYIALTSLPSSAVWPDSLGGFLLGRHIKRVAIVYASNDFDASQAKTLAALLKAGHDGPVYDQATPTSTSSYTDLIHAISATHPNAVIEFGYDTNDIAFLQNLTQSGLRFPMVFTIFPGQELPLFLKDVGSQELRDTYTYPTPPLVAYNKVNYGLGVNTFLKEFRAQSHSQPDFLDVAGYNAGLVIQKDLSVAPNLSQLALRRALNRFSGKLFTLDGRFKINSTGAQVGELLPVAQFQASHGSVAPIIIYPKNLATGKAIYPAK